MAGISINDVVRIYLTPKEVKDVLETVTQKIDISKMDNLRYRHKNIQFDCLLRGYIGEYGIVKWLKEYDIGFESTNYIQENENIDIDFYYKGKNIELKTSLIPDTDVIIDKAIERRDIKLIKRGDSKIEDLRGDIHLQIYYSQKRRAKDNWLQAQQINIESKDIDYLYHAFKADLYQSSTFFVAWIDKEALVTHINALPEKERYWSFRGSKRLFWNCKIQQSKKPIDLVHFLRSIK